MTTVRNGRPIAPATLSSGLVASGGAIPGYTRIARGRVRGGIARGRVRGGIARGRVRGGIARGRVRDGTARRRVWGGARPVVATQHGGNEKNA
jgi:hypothetical protein